MAKVEVKNRFSNKSVGLGLVFGAGLGLIFGQLYGNMGLGMIFGIALGLSLGNLYKYKK